VTHHTQIEKYRANGKVDELLNFDFDHTACAMVVNIEEGEGNYFNIIFTKNQGNDNIIIDFPDTKGIVSYPIKITLR
jgi:hypothetical protein